MAAGATVPTDPHVPSGPMLPAVLLAVALANLVTFVTFGVDKWRARRSMRRVPEATLLWMAFLTGFVGAWVAMNVFRHKTRKTGFRVRLLLVSVCNAAWPLLWITWRGDLG